ncbi:xanthine permease domain protein [Clostridioides difficile DA00165]|nr:xanthine permease domain protein [Clostridioides difficile DA00165]
MSYGLWFSSSIWSTDCVSEVRHIFTPIVSGTIIACMGLGLFATAIKNLAGGEGTQTFGSPITSSRSYSCFCNNNDK